MRVRVKVRVRVRVRVWVRVRVRFGGSVLPLAKVTLFTRVRVKG